MSITRVFIVTNNAGELNYRASVLQELSGNFEIILICRKHKSNKATTNNRIYVKSSFNFYSIFKRFSCNKLYKYLNDITYFPSPRILYIRNVTKYLCSVIKKRPDFKFVIITICPPHDVAIVGLKLKEKFPKILWINDLQDLWSNDEYYFDRIPKRRKSKILDLENRFFKIADKTVVTNEMAEDFCVKQFNIPRARIHTIYHPYRNLILNKSFNDDDLIKRIRNGGPVKLAFVGGLFKGSKVPGEMLIKELSRFTIKHQFTLVFNVIGSPLPDSFEKYRNASLIINENLNLNHDEAYKLASNSDFLILLLGEVPNSKLVMHGKYPHYLASNMPILAFVPDGSFIQKSIFSTNAGFFIDIDSDIPESLDNIFRSIINNGLPRPDLVEIKKFSREVFLNKWHNLIICEK